ncbi:metabotropic glutamate receptor 7-like [Styela clava]
MVKKLGNRQCFLLLLCLQAALATSWPKSKKNIVQHRDGDIIIGGFVYVPQEDQGIQTVEVINMVVDQVNKDENILPGITIGTIMINTNRSGIYTMPQIVNEFFPLFSDLQQFCEVNFTNCKKKPLFAGFIGASSSTVSIHTSRLLQGYSIPQISYWATNSILSNKNEFPYFFRTVPSDDHQTEAMIEFVYSRRWNYISIVYENSHYGTRGYKDLEVKAAARNICIAEALSMPTDNNDDNTDEVDEVIETLRAKHGNRTSAVILLLTEKAAKKIMQSAANSNSANHFLWIGGDAWTKLLPERTENEFDSYKYEIDGAIGFLPKSDPVPGFENHFKNLKLETNRHRNPWFAEYFSKIKNCSLVADPPDRCPENESIDLANFKHFPYNGRIANAVLSFVHAVNKIHQEECNGRSGICEKMEMMTGTTEFASRTAEHLKNVTFQEIDGHQFYFNEHQDAPPEYDIFNYKMETENWVKVGIYSSSGIRNLSVTTQKVLDTKSNCSDECEPHHVKEISQIKCCWICKPCGDLEFVSNESKCERCAEGQKPNSSYTGCEKMVKIYMSYEKPESIASLALGIFGTISTIVISALYYKYKETPIVKASGKELCFVVLFGIFITFANCWFIISYPSIASCILSRTILSLGPTIMYGALLMKTLRVVIIFRNKVLSPNIKLLLRPRSQLAFTTLLTFVQVLVLVIWFAIDGPEIKMKKTEDIGTVFLTCHTFVHSEVKIGLIYPFLLIILTTILATVNRNVPTGFNEAKLVGFTMYTTCVIWLGFIAIFVTNETNYGLKLTVVSLCLSLNACTVLFCMFGHRCYTILFHPEQNTSQSVMTPKRSSYSVRSNSSRQKKDGESSLYVAEVKHEEQDRT